MYRIVSHCRACDSNELIPVFDLGIQPLANDFCTAEQDRAGYAPLKVLFCPRCTLAQLSVVVRPEILYSHYSYVTSKSDTMLQHFGMLWSHILEECDPVSVVEIGSNDGGFLEFVKSTGVKNVFGIDPASNLCSIANEKQIPCVPSVFDYNAAYHAKGQVTSCHGAENVSVIMARHVFCHMDNWREFIQNCEILADRNTVVCIEVPYVMDTLVNSEFDQIYHEHLSFFSLTALNHLLQGS